MVIKPRVDKAFKYTKKLGVVVPFTGVICKNTRMKIDFDPEWIRTSMELWRKTVNMQIPVYDSFRIHFFEQRGSILVRFVETAKAWGTVLRGCSAAGADLVELNSIKADVETFKNWAENELKVLSSLASEESAKDNPNS